MHRGHVGLAAGLLVALGGQSATAQLQVIQFDINGIGAQARNAAGASAPFGGLTHTGSLALQSQASLTELLTMGISTNGGSFVVQGGPWNLTNLVMTINLSNGNITGGSMSFDVSGGPPGGDNYHATVAAAGHVANYVGGGFLLEGLTTSGAFSDASFGSVAIANFFPSTNLQGNFLLHLDTPGANGASFADLDDFVQSVPGPASAMVLVAGVMACARRRR